MLPVEARPRHRGLAGGRRLRRVSHASAYSPAAGVGWAGGAIQSRDRGGADLLRRDLNFTPRGLFDVFLENGIYDVTLTLGDAAGAHDQMGVSVQGAKADSITTAKNQFVTRRWRTCVADNRLEVLLDDLGGNDANVVVNAIEIAPPRPRGSTSARRRRPSSRVRCR